MTELELSWQDIEHILIKFPLEKRKIYLSKLKTMDDIEFIEIRKFEGICQYTYYNKTGLTGHHGKWNDLIDEPHHREEVINFYRNDNVRIGNEPHHYINENMWRRYKDNIFYCDAWMSWLFDQNKLAEFRTEYGNIYMLEDKVVHADINLHYGGLVYNLIIWNDYGSSPNSVDLIHITGSTNPGYTFYGTKGCEERHSLLARKRKEISKDKAEKIIKPTKEMGYAPRRAIEHARKQLLFDKI